MNVPAVKFDVFVHNDSFSSSIHFYMNLSPIIIK